MKLGIYIFVLALTLICSTHAASQPVLKIYPQIHASGHTICLDDLGTLYARQSEKTALKQVCLSRQDLLNEIDGKGMLPLALIADQIAAKNSLISVVGPDRVKVQTQPAQTAGQLIKSAQVWLQGELEKRFESVEVAPAPHQPIGRWKNNLRWQVRQESVLPTQHQCVWMDGYGKHGIQQSWPACFRVKAMSKVLVYGKDLAVGDVIDPALLSFATVDVTTLVTQPAELPTHSVYIASSLLKAGTPILENDVRMRPDVLKNGPVVIVSKVGHVEILAQGHAIEEGQIGDLVRVKSKGGDAPFRATVTGKDKVTIGGDA